MFRQGHYGVSLIVFAPVGFALIRLGRPDLAFVVGVVMLWLAMLPDVDHRIPGIPHRGPTHSLAFAGLVGGVFALVGQGLVLAGVDDIGLAAIADGSVVVFGFLVGFLTVIAHLLGDALTPAGVNFLWPLSGYEYTVSAWRADNKLANYGLFGVGIFAVAAALYLAATL
ncbi:metal-dependent hydrolase [Halogeometricum borinquense]|uniref:Metal-dependent hydrolase n=1 Tax=Halogeometricum borinquense TaxID=60847 RepID=A0A6C0UJ07_9EURY|nr:metal-dependent hydrolase [Halogeometricum borinquense]QIB73829.1 metal-dependent hydrolase [Halogeometricum borinquense]QIQ76813.1 metal-dependent hydrolase [Halogeometricum borinquense]